MKYVKPRWWGIKGECVSIFPSLSAVANSFTPFIGAYIAQLLINRRPYRWGWTREHWLSNGGLTSLSQNGQTMVQSLIRIAPYLHRLYKVCIILQYIRNQAAHYKSTSMNQHVSTLVNLLWYVTFRTYLHYKKIQCKSITIYRILCFTCYKQKKFYMYR